jgi:hypothetical protein
MGRASRHKRERRATRTSVEAQPSMHDSGIFRSSDPGSHADEFPVGLPLYRFFREESHADDFAAGRIWISTLAACRKHEERGRGDPGEGTLTYRTGSVVGGSSDTAFVSIAARAGIHIGPGCSNISISDCTSHQRIEDAYVLCMTERYSPELLSETFGRFCVRIPEPRLLFNLLSTVMQSRYRTLGGLLGRVRYVSRHFSGTSPVPGHPGFVKPPDEYVDQAEVRMLWTAPLDNRIEPFLVHVPQATNACERVA